jgi:hypothetical protein
MRPARPTGGFIYGGEDGEVFVVRAGAKVELPARNSMGELLLATPAMSGGMMYARTQHHPFAIGN